MNLTIEHIAIMQHTLHRATYGYYCGNSKEMKELVEEGLMISAGRKSFVSDEYFKLTDKGKEFIKTIESNMK